MNGIRFNQSIRLWLPLFLFVLPAASLSEIAGSTQTRGTFTATIRNPRTRFGVTENAKEYVHGKGEGYFRKDAGGLQ